MFSALLFFVFIKKMFFYIRMVLCFFSSMPFAKLLDWTFVTLTKVIGQCVDLDEREGDVSGLLITLGWQRQEEEMQIEIQPLNGTL